jgi:hypothetical protein
LVYKEHVSFLVFFLQPFSLKVFLWFKVGTFQKNAGDMNFSNRLYIVFFICTESNPTRDNYIGGLLKDFSGPFFDVSN